MSNVNSQNQTDVAIVGGGIVGLSHAMAAAKRGLSVTVFERTDKAEAASVRNFGMIWPIGVPAGPLHDAALVGRQMWIELAVAAGFWLSACGSVFIAREPDELAVFEEYLSTDRAKLAGCALLTHDALRAKCPGARSHGLLGGLWSPLELAVDPREAIVAITNYLQIHFAVRFEFGAMVTEIESPTLRTSDGRRWRFDEALVCGGAEFRTLFPEVFVNSGVRRCKLQMMRTAPQPNGWRLKTHVAGGASLRHYSGFADCPSVEKLRQRIADQRPEFDRFGIHILAAQNQLGEVIIGDSHEYDDAIEPFDKSEIDEIVLKHLLKIIDIPSPRIAQRWHGIYPRHASLAQFVHSPQPGVTIVLNTNGMGMTLSFGLAEQYRVKDQIPSPQSQRASSSAAREKQ